MSKKVATAVPRFIFYLVVLNILTFFITNHTFGQTLNPIRPVSKPPKWEVWYDKVPVSGDIRVGLMNEYTNGPVSPGSFYVVLPTKKETKLCVEISSWDGRYEASLEYDISGVPPGVQMFELPTAYKDKLNKFQKKNLAVLARGATTCTSEKYNIYPASWSENSQKSDTLYLLVNSENPTKIGFTDKQGVNQEIECKKISNPSAIAFNCICALPKKNILNAETCAIVQRVKKGSIRKVNTYPVPIKI